VVPAARVPVLPPVLPPLVTRLGDSLDNDPAESSGMLSSDEIVRSCLSETWRYRLAIQIQLSRIGAANKAVLDEREQIEKDEQELLFAPSMSAETFQR
jgi:hypothetical protein